MRRGRKRSADGQHFDLEGGASRGTLAERASKKAILFEGTLRKAGTRDYVPYGIQLEVIVVIVTYYRWINCLNGV